MARFKTPLGGRRALALGTAEVFVRTVCSKRCLNRQDPSAPTPRPGNAIHVKEGKTVAAYIRNEGRLPAGEKSSGGGSSQLILAPQRSTGHPHSPSSEGPDSNGQRQRVFLPAVCPKDPVLCVTPKFKFHPQCPPTQIPARQPRNHPISVCS